MTEKEKWEDRHFQIFRTLLGKHDISYYDKENKDADLQKLLAMTDLIIDRLMKHEAKRRSDNDRFGSY